MPAENQARAEELRFAGDSYLTTALVEEDRARGEFAVTRPLERSPDGALHGSFSIRLQRASNFSAP